MAADDSFLAMVSTSASSSGCDESGNTSSKMNENDNHQPPDASSVSDSRGGEQNSSDSVDEDDDELLIEEEEHDDGHCPTCGIQLFKMQKKSWFHRKKTTGMSPLTLTGIVEDGVCVACTNDTISSRNLSVDDASTTRAESPPPAVGGGETLFVGDYNIYGQRHGQGETIFSNGDRYVGNFFNGTRDGQGTLWFADGSEYAGNWSCNRMHGEGTRRFANGDVYSGSYKDGKREGMGKFYFSNGDLYHGLWRGDVVNGSGKYFFASGKCFEGNFQNGSRHGKGKTQYPSGAIDIFCYDEDRKVGNGVRWSANRKKVWLLKDGGRIRKRIAIPEAVSIGYQCDGDPKLLLQFQEFSRPDTLPADVVEEVLD